MNKHPLKRLAAGMFVWLMVGAALSSCDKNTAQDPSGAISSAAPDVQTPAPEQTSEKESEEDGDTKTPEETATEPEIITGINAVDPGIRHIAFMTVREEIDVLQEDLIRPDGALLSGIGDQLIEYLTALKGLVRVTCDRLNIDGEAWPALAQAIDARQEEVFMDAQGGGVRAVTKLRLSGGGTDAFFYREDHPVIVLRADSVLFSYAQDGKVYHFRPEDAKRLSLKDVVTDTDAFYMLAAEMLLTYGPQPIPDAGTEDIFRPDVRTLARTLAEDGSLIWAPAYYGMRVIADGALIGEAGRTIDLTIPYTVSPELYDTAYTTQPASCMAKLTPEIAYPFEAEDEIYTLIVTAETAVVPAGDNESRLLPTGTYRIAVQQDDAVLEETFTVSNFHADLYQGTDLYLVRDEDRLFLYLDVREADGQDLLHIFSFDGSAFRFAGMSSEMIDTDANPPFDPSCFTVEHYYRIFPDTVTSFGGEKTAGTRAHNRARITTGGMPEVLDASYLPAERAVFVTRQRLTMEVLATDGVSSAGRQSFPENTTLTMVSYMLNVSVDFETDDGTRVRLFINGVDGIDNIDGVPIEDALMQAY